MSKPDRCICIHGHFYQPPREDPWTGMIEPQPSAAPFHNWNARITDECYRPNGESRILDANDRLEVLVNNYASISFNFGPTLLSWLEENAPDVYARIREADRDSAVQFGGHGSAIAQAFSHMIMPLADPRDQRTQVLWGMEDFRHRFSREPEGMWLPETAVNIATLEALAVAGIRFTILEPGQASRYRGIGLKRWHKVADGGIDPSRPYTVRLPSGRSIAVFFYDGPVSRAVAFENLLDDGGRFTDRLMTGFDYGRNRPQLVHIATDGETYGHHHRHGDMALAFALRRIRRDDLARIVNYGQYLELHPPDHEAEIRENTAWSCAHGIERWRSDCGCATGLNPEWNQAWREPLRDALDRLRDRLRPPFEEAGAALFHDPWLAREDYIRVLLDPGPASEDRFLAEHGKTALEGDAREKALNLMELQRHAMLMYTSCGWFFDDLAGLEGLQILRYAGRAIQLSETLFGGRFTEPFLNDLDQAVSNDPAAGSGRQVFEARVAPLSSRLPSAAPARRK